MSPIRQALRSGGMFFLIPLLIGCGGGEEAIPSAPSLAILSPQAGQTVSSTTVEVQLRVTGFNLVNKLGQPAQEGEGHYHYWLDQKTGTGTPGYTSTFTLTNLTEGQHTLWVELRNNDHTPLSPPVEASVTFTVTVVTQVRLSTDVQPIFTARCALSGCHDSATRRAGLDLSEGNAYVNLVNVNSSQDARWKRVVPGSPQESLLYLKVSQDSPPVGGRMPPPPRSALTADQQDKIRDWILQGAQIN